MRRGLRPSRLGRHRRKLVGRGVILVLGTLDTKLPEIAFLAECIRARGYRPWIVDLSLREAPGGVADVPREKILEAAGTSPHNLEAMPKSEAMGAVAAGAGVLVRAMVENGEATAVVAVGGGQGTWLASSVMRALPLGFPKLIASTIANRDIAPFVGYRDVTMMPTVVDLAGLNSILKPILANAAGAICGMAGVTAASPQPPKPRLALTMFGVTTLCATRARAALETAGFEVVVFHANGVGGATMEDLVREGYFVGVVDLTTTELIDELVGGICSAGPHRLEAAGVLGLPQIVVPGAMDVVNFGPPESVPARFAERRLHAHTPVATLMRTSVEESAVVGKIMAQKLNRGRGRITVLIPIGGFSALDAPGGPFEDRAANEAFVLSLRQFLNPAIVVREFPDHINSERFAQAVIDATLMACPVVQQTSP